MAGVPLKAEVRLDVRYGRSVPEGDIATVARSVAVVRTPKRESPPFCFSTRSIVQVTAKQVCITRHYLRVERFTRLCSVRTEYVTREIEFALNFPNSLVLLRW